MKLKPIAASVFLLMSGAAFAATNGTQAQLDAMQSQLNHMQQLINQNNGGAQTGGGTSLQSTLQTSSDWSNAIAVSGLLNVDAIASNRTAVGTGINNSEFGNSASSNIQLSNADVFVDAQVNDWTKAHIGFNFDDQNNNNNALGFAHNSVNQIITANNANSPFVDEAYVTLGNFTESPIYFRAGRQYLNFGNYDRFAAVPTFTQLLSETNETAATLGFVSNGFYGSFYGFRGLNEATDIGNTTQVNNFGGNLGFSNKSDGMGYNLEAGYLNNFADVTYVGETVGVSGFNMDTTGYTKKVGAVSLDGTMTVGMFDADVHWVSATSSDSDISTVSNGTVKNATPKALTIGAGVTFPVIGHSSRLGVDYQHSWQAENVGSYGLPQQRYEATYGVDVSKNVNVGLDLFTDRDYSVSNGGTGLATTTGLVRLGVMFA